MNIDSGYASFEGENEDMTNEVDNAVDSNAEESQSTDSCMIEQTYQTRHSQEEEDEEDDRSFQAWLKKVAECLEGKKKGDLEKMEIIKEDLSEEERCMKIARRVLDEVTVLDMVKTYLNFTRVRCLPQQRYFLLQRPKPIKS